MASVRTEITELATGLGMLGFDSPAEAIRRLPKQLVDVDEAVWKKFVSAVDEPSHRVDFAGAFRNGQVFLEAKDGLRGRPPLLVEWKGGHRSPSHDQLPIDLRVDRVYLVSCKYSSKILLNAAPSNLLPPRAMSGTGTTLLLPSSTKPCIPRSGQKSPAA